jgi:hypothetical protein
MWNGAFRLFAFIPLLILALTRGWRGLSVGYFIGLPVFCVAMYYSDYTDKDIIAGQLSNLMIFLSLMFVGVLSDVNKEKCKA